MLRNYLKIAWRNLLRRKFYALVNILGLAVGITFTLLIGSFVHGEFLVNASLRNLDRQFLVQSQWKVADMGMDITTLAPLGPALKAQYPGLVANYYRFHGVNATVSWQEKHFRESIQVGDSTLLSMYGFPLLHGDVRTAFQGTNSVVITEEIAVKFFDQTNVLNQVLRIETPAAGSQDFIITGVLKSLPYNSVSHLLPENNYIFLPMSSIRYFGSSVEPWQNPYIVTYLELREGVTPEDLEKPITQLITSRAPVVFKENLQIYLTPLRDYYWQANHGLARKMVLTLASVALFILLMALVNFVNISIGNSTTRLKEIGVRKVLGGLRKQLIGQFLSESIILTALATMFSLAFYQLFHPSFGDLLDKPLLHWWQYSGHYAGMLVGFVLITGLLAGMYPAFILSASPSVDSLKGKWQSVKGGILFRRVLVTFQFAIAIFVFVGAVVVSRQVTYFFNKDLGYQKEQVLTVSSVPRDWSSPGVERMETVRNEFARLPGVQQVSVSYEIPNGNNGGNAYLFRAEQDSTQAVVVKMLTTDEKFAQTYGINLAEGQFFHASQNNYDGDRIVINEAAARALGWKETESVVGRRVRLQGGSRTFTVCGVIRNFHFASLQEDIRPMVLLHLKNTSLYRFLSFKIAPNNLTATISAIEKTWASFFPNAPFDYAFMDDTLQKLYQSELQLKKAAEIATVLALVIVLLGVMGLVSLSVARRAKEIGIRKVMGATVSGIVLLFLKEFALVMIVANMIAWPIAFAVMKGWLTNYAYRIDIDWSPFIGVGFIIALLTALVAGSQAIKVALANPVKSLRTE
jgi:putative ABC transport system permease protein